MDNRVCCIIKGVFFRNRVEVEWDPGIAFPSRDLGGRLVLLRESNVLQEDPFPKAIGAQSSNAHAIVDLTSTLLTLHRMILTLRT